MLRMLGLFSERRKKSNCTNHVGMTSLIRKVKSCGGQMFRWPR